MAVHEVQRARGGPDPWAQPLISAIPELVSQFPNLPAHVGGKDLRANVQRVLSDSEFGRSRVKSSHERVTWADIRRHDQLFQRTVDRLLGR
jgi:hypothetical protein